MFEFIKAWREKKHYQAQQYKLAARRLRDICETVRDEDPEYTILQGEKETDEFDHYTMQQQAYHLWKTNPHARAIIRTLEKFILGKGLKIFALDENPVVQEWWDDFEKENRFLRRQDEIIRRTFRDGECFIRYFVDQYSGKTRIRFLEPHEISDAENIHSFGIETDPDDIEIPLRYYRYRQGKLIEVIPAEEVQHIKIFADSNVKRGLSFLYIVMPLLKKYEQWLNDRIVLNKIRSAMAIIRRISGSPAQLSDLVGKEKSRKGRQKMLKPGSIITVSEGVDYQMLTPNLQAQDVQYDGRNILLAIASATGLAEYMVSGDASNANYASTMVSESPAVREFEDWQQFFQEEFSLIFAKVIKAGIDYGSLPAQSSITSLEIDQSGKRRESKQITPTRLDCEIIFPPLIHRKLKEESEALALHKNMGIVSNQTVAARLGYDFQKEIERIEKEGIERESSATLDSNNQDLP
jgi:capsid protein